MRSEKVQSTTVKGLVLLGEMLKSDVDSCTPEFLKRYRHYKWINMAGIDALTRIAQSLSERDLCCLIMGITFAERELSWTGGSVGGVITLFKYLQNTSGPEVYEPIADWVIANRGNSYIPYGTTRYSGATHSECMEYKRRLENANIEYNNELAQLRKEAQNLKAKLAKQREMTAKDRGTQIHKERISGLSKLAIAEQLVSIANDEVYSIGFYPKYIPASVTSKDIQKLDNVTISKLQNKLMGKAWGPWKKLKALLADASVPSSSYPSKPDFM